MDILVKEYSLPPFDRKEIQRYIGGSGEDIAALVDECISECVGIFSSKVCFRRLPVTYDGINIDFSLFKVQSAALSKNLCGCSEAVVFAATAGIGIDRLIAKYSRISPSKALVFQGIGAERIEALCDVFCDELKSTEDIRPRFSPGYGDLPLEIQKEIFSVLGCNKNIGLYLNDSFLMSPTKSVTAIVGIKNASSDRSNNT